MSDTLPGSRARHGTPSGWTAHQNRGERPCDACYAAKAEYDKRRKTAPEEVRRSRLHARAQARAETEIKRLYPGVWRALYQQHLDALRAEEGDA